MKYKRHIIGSASLLVAALALLVALSGSSLAAPPLVADPADPVFINEIHYDNASGDTGEAIEVAGPAGTDLTGWRLVLYNGNGGGEYDTINLSGAIPDEQDGCGTLAFLRAGIQNGSPDGIALVDGGNTVRQFLSYEGSFTAVDGPASGLTSTDIDVSEPSDSPVDESLQLKGTGSLYGDFAWSSPSPDSFGAVNDGQTFSGCAASPTPTPTPTPLPAPEVEINEIRVDQPSDDNDEYFELVGASGTSLDGLTYLVIGDGTGGSGVIEAVIDLGGNTIPASGFFVVAENTFSLGTADLTANLNFENSDNVTHLLVSGFSGSNGDDLDTNDDGTLDATPWTEVVDLIALVEEENPPSGTEYHYGPPSIGPDGSFVPGHVFRCLEGWVIGEFDPASGDDTPGAENDCAIGPEFGACGDPATFIHSIQGSGLTSPEVGNSHVVEGVVVGDFQDSATGLGGFFLQEEDGQADGDPATSEGLFVYDAGFGVEVNPGDVVRVLGDVAEFYDLTELKNVSNLAVCSTGATVTAATVSLPVSDLADWEPYEGMLVTIPQTLFVTENYNQGRYGEVALSVGERLYNPTNVVPPGQPALDLQDLNDRSRVQLDDGSNVENPLPLPPYLGPDDTLRGGDTLPGLTGVLGFAYGTYEIHPTGSVVFNRVNARETTPAPVSGRLKVASFNVLNYFTTIDTGAEICGPSADQGCRGADSEVEFMRQRDKIISAITSMDADVIGLMELENHPTDQALQNLVAGLNEAVGAGTYAFIPTGPIGTDAIKVGFIYKPASVTPVGNFETLDSFDDPLFDDAKNRPALAQTFEENATGERFTVVVNHLKSKGSSCDDVGDPDQGDGQGNCNLTRTNAATALVNWLGSDPTASGDPDFLIIGDLNAYAMEDPITAIKNAGYSNLVETFIGVDAYSYVFEGQAGYLDHALANPSLTLQVTGVVEWHINADEPSALDYNDFNQPDLYNADPFRASDHDPVIVGLALRPQCNGQTATIWVEGGVVHGGYQDGNSYSAVLLGTPEDDVMVGTDGFDRISGLDGDDLICGRGGRDTLLGRGGNDLLLGEDGNDRIRGDWGDDVLVGGDGNRDLCNGGSGTDTAAACEIELLIP
jgi:predicted extracellular nuclease